MSRIGAQDIVFDELPTGHFDFCFRPYDAPCSALPRFHSETLLRHILRSATALESIGPLVKRLQVICGENKIVWGAKWSKRPALESIEFYIRRRTVGAAGEKLLGPLLHAAEPWISHVPQYDESWPYVMCSLEIHIEKGEAMRKSCINIYLPRTSNGSNRDGVSYELTRAGPVFANYYRRFDKGVASNELRDAIELWPTAAHKIVSQTLHSSWAKNSNTIILGIKRDCDGIYFNRLPLSSILALTFIDGAAEVIAAVSENAQNFSHLLWDIGIDFDRGYTGGRKMDYQKFALFGFC